MALASIETRWFLEDASVDSKELSRWFRSRAVGGVPPREPFVDRRTDLYLWLGPVMDLGVKAREGRLEIKGRREATGTRFFGRRHQGRVERWLKWSLDGQAWAPRRRAPRGGRAAGSALPVEKARLLRKLEVLDDETVVEVSARRQDLPRGVSAELTRVRWDAGVWWSIAFEGFPDGALRLQTFQEVVREFLKTLDAISLDPLHSRGYPEWIRERVVEAEGKRARSRRR